MSPNSAPVSRISAEYRELEANDPLLLENPHRWVMFPIEHADIWQMYKQHEASFWTAKEIDLSQDNKDWHQLSESERHFVKHVLAFFAASDGIVLENLVSSFSIEVQVPEARAFYRVQTAMESIHSEMCSLLIEQSISDPAEKDEVLNAMQIMPAVKEKAEWAIQWMNREKSFAERIVGFAAVEGILSSCAFGAAYCLKTRGLMPGLTFSNELISRDEALHAEFACLLYRKLVNPLPEDVIHGMIQGAVDVECNFIDEALSSDVVGMNSEMMIRYTEFVADHLLTALGHSKLYNVSNPFEWMDLNCLQDKTNCFKNRFRECQKVDVMASKSQDDIKAFTLDVDF